MACQQEPRKLATSDQGLVQLQIYTAGASVKSFGEGNSGTQIKSAGDRKMDLATAQLLLQFLPMLDSAHKLQADALSGFHKIVETYNDCLRRKVERCSKKFLPISGDTHSAVGAVGAQVAV